MDQYDLQGAGLSSVAPPPAPMGRRMPGKMGRGIRMLTQLHPNHPIFKKYPGLAQMFARHAGGPQPPQPLPQPGVQGAPPPGPTPDPSGSQVPPYMQNIPQTMEGYGGWGAAPEPAAQDPMAVAQQHLMGRFAQGNNDPAARDRSPQGNIRDRLMQRYHTAGPQEPSLTSRAAMQHFLQKQGRNKQARQPMLPLRQAAHRRPY